MHAAAIGSVEAMQLLIDKGADVNARSTAGATALMWAATDLAKVRLLVEHGADVRAASDSGRTALLLAAMSDPSAEIVRLLLSRGADPRAADKDRMTPVFAAAFGNDVETLRQLVAAGADVNSPTVTGRHAAHAGGRERQRRRREASHREGRGRQRRQRSPSAARSRTASSGSAGSRRSFWLRPTAPSAS